MSALKQRNCENKGVAQYVCSLKRAGNETFWYLSDNLTSFFYQLHVIQTLLIIYFVAIILL
jgi:hypothetical protein